MRIERPASPEEFAEVVKTSRKVSCFRDPLWDVAAPEVETELDPSSWTGLTYYSPEDLVATMRSGTRITELQAALCQHGQCLPWGGTVFGEQDPTIGQALGYALPHLLEGPWRSWREWLLGAKVVLGDGLVASSGSRVVKSVAGYDAHKLTVGARGTLGIVLEVTLRLYPMRCLDGVFTHQPGYPGRPWIQRTLATHFPSAMESAGGSLVHADLETSTLWACPTQTLPRFADDWAIRGSPGEIGLNETFLRFYGKARRLMDPESKLNPGALVADDL
jgi:hypothetical protein